MGRGGGGFGRCFCGSGAIHAGLPNPPSVAFVGINLIRESLWLDYSKSDRVTPGIFPSTRNTEEGLHADALFLSCSILSARKNVGRNVASSRGSISLQDVREPSPSPVEIGRDGWVRGKAGGGRGPTRRFFRVQYLSHQGALPHNSHDKKSNCPVKIDMVSSCAI